MINYIAHIKTTYVALSSDNDKLYAISCIGNVKQNGGSVMNIDWDRLDDRISYQIIRYSLFWSPTFKIGDEYFLYSGCRLKYIQDIYHTKQLENMFSNWNICVQLI
jgi:hypothetical protein